ncbi:hypothetical protein BVI1335_400090 [Burkholderia vietnamiensis]|nr:hypothetical protein BVI1335_400090 [Burkholderia vietnamiensis]
MPALLRLALSQSCLSQHWRTESWKVPFRRRALSSTPHRKRCGLLSTRTWSRPSAR